MRMDLCVCVSFSWVSCVDLMFSHLRIEWTVCVCVCASSSIDATVMWDSLSLSVCAYSITINWYRRHKYKRQTTPNPRIPSVFRICRVISYAPLNCFTTWICKRHLTTSTGPTTNVVKIYYFFCCCCCITLSEWVINEKKIREIDDWTPVNAPATVCSVMVSFFDSSPPWRIPLMIPLAPKITAFRNPVPNSGAPTP